MGPVIRAYLLHIDEGGVDFHAICWDVEAGRWVNLLGEPLPDHLRFEAWGTD
jgi:hypothetical protein